MKYEESQFACEDILARCMAPETLKNPDESIADVLERWAIPEVLRPFLLQFLLAEAARLRERLDAYELELVSAARDHRVKWAQIAEALDRSHDSVYRQYRLTGPDPDPVE